MLLLAVINVDAYPFDYQLIITAIWVILGTCSPYLAQKCTK